MSVVGLVSVVSLVGVVSTKEKKHRTVLAVRLRPNWRSDAHKDQEGSCSGICDAVQGGKSQNSTLLYGCDRTDAVMRTKTKKGCKATD